MLSQRQWKTSRPCARARSEFCMPRLAVPTYCHDCSRGGHYCCIGMSMCAHLGRQPHAKPQAGASKQHTRQHMRSTRAPTHDSCTFVCTRRGVGNLGKPLHYKGSPFHRIIPGGSAFHSRIYLTIVLLSGIRSIQCTTASSYQTASEPAKCACLVPSSGALHLCHSRQLPCPHVHFTWPSYPAHCHVSRQGPTEPTPWHGWQHGALAALCLSSHCTPNMQAAVSLQPNITAGPVSGAPCHTQPGGTV